MKKPLKLKYLSALMTAGLLMTAPVQAEDALAIMQRVDQLDDGDTRTSKTTMTLINKHGSQRVRQLVSYAKDYPGETKQVMVFTQPADVKGVANLSYEYDDVNKNDDTWLYLPAMRKARRIAGAARNGYFMGSDFTYDDMGDRQPEEDTHSLLREEQRDGVNCWVIESRPLDANYMYSKRVSWVRQDNDMINYVEYYDRQGQLLKTLSVRDIKQVDGLWAAGIMEMHNVQDDHRTVIENNEIVFNQPVKDRLFRVSTLERGQLR